MRNPKTTNTKSQLAESRYERGAGGGQVTVYPREVAKRALEINVSAIILVHDQPSGDRTPSQDNVAMTELIARACKAIGVAIHDHVVIGKQSDAAFRTVGLVSSTEP